MDKSIEVRRLLGLVSVEMRSLVDALDQKTRDDDSRNIVADLHSRLYAGSFSGGQMKSSKDELC